MGLVRDSLESKIQLLKCLRFSNLVISTPPDFLDSKTFGWIDSPGDSSRDLLRSPNVGGHKKPSDFGSRFNHPKKVTKNWVFPKMMVPPNHPWINRVFHHFNHPFWCFPIFGNTKIAWIFGEFFVGPPRMRCNLLAAQQMVSESLMWS